MPPAPLRVVAPAKINLYLGVHTATDAAGYHRVDSVMAALGLADEVELFPADELSLTCQPAVSVPPEQSAAWRAAVALGKALGREPRARIHLTRRIPVQAGLGGPSTDTAAVLRGLCTLWDVEPVDQRVVRVAQGIGADVPFFLGGSPAYLSGRGDALEEVFCLDEPLPVVLVKPVGASVSTPAAYRAFDADPVALPLLEPLLDALRAGRGAEVPALVANNLAPASCSLEPQIPQVLDWLRAQDGVLAADVCGSGACSFGLCASAGDAQRIARAAAAHDAAWWSCATQCITQFA